MMDIPKNSGSMEDASQPSSTKRFSALVEGWIYGFLGVLGFSLTLPATRLAVAELDPLLVGLGRAVFASLLAAPLLIFTKQPLPSRAQWRSIFLVFVGAIVGFPVLSAWAMQYESASHGAIILGLLPLATAVAGTLTTGESPSRGFWLSSLMGSLAVIAYAQHQGNGALSLYDFALFAAVLLAALGYAEGARAARELGGWQVICWALVLSAPVLIGPFLYLVSVHGLQASAPAWGGFIYISVISMFLAFFAWYHGLAVGGVARISQIQLLQPFLTLAFSATFLGETFTLGAVVAATVVGVSLIISRRSHITLRSK